MLLTAWSRPFHTLTFLTWTYTEQSNTKSVGVPDFFLFFQRYEKPMKKVVFVIMSSASPVECNILLFSAYNAGRGFSSAVLWGLICWRRLHWSTYRTIKGFVSHPFLHGTSRSNATSDAFAHTAPHHSPMQVTASVWYLSVRLQGIIGIDSGYRR